MDIIQAKQAGKRVFKVTLPLVGSIYFTLLSWKEYKAFSQLLALDNISKVQIEDIIFNKCVLQADVARELCEKRAGLVTTIANLILTLSGPADVETIAENLNIARKFINILDLQIISIIVQAFPAYSPEDIENMSWSDVVIRLAQAEQILMAKGVLEEPLRIMDKPVTSANQVDPAQLVEDGKRMQKEMGIQQEHKDVDPAMKQKLLERREKLRRILESRKGR